MTIKHDSPYTTPLSRQFEHETDVFYPAGLDHDWTQLVSRALRPVLRLRSDQPTTAMHAADQAIYDLVLP